MYVELHFDKGVKHMKNEGFDQLAYARRIRSAGRSIYIPQDDGQVRSIPSEDLLVRQTGGVIESSAFDWGAGAGFKINLVITSRISGLAVSHIEFRPPWKQMYFWWLEDPEMTDGSSRRYRFRRPVDSRFPEGTGHQPSFASDAAVFGRRISRGPIAGGWLRSDSRRVFSGKNDPDVPGSI